MKSQHEFPNPFGPMRTLFRRTWNTGMWPEHCETRILALSTKERLDDYLSELHAYQPHRYITAGSAVWDTWTRFDRCNFRLMKLCWPDFYAAINSRLLWWTPATSDGMRQRISKTILLCRQTVTLEYASNTNWAQTVHSIVMMTLFFT